MTDPTEFSEAFKSPLFTVLVGPDRTSYNLHKDTLSRKSPYFKTLLSFPGIESSTDTVHLDSSVDTVQAFDMLVQFLYHDTYVPAHTLSDSWKVQIHAEVYVLAERLLMPDLKTLALESMVRTLSRLYGSKSVETYDPTGKTWRSEDVTVVDLTGLPDLIDTVYTNLGTESKGEDKTKADVPEKPGVIENKTAKTKNPLKQIVARYCASVIDTIRHNKPEIVRELVEAHPEFAADLIMELEQRSRQVYEDETQRL